MQKLLAFTAAKAWIRNSREGSMASYLCTTTRSQKAGVKTTFFGGQWQRIALPCAFMRLQCADFLVLDESSAALDPAAEYNLFRRLKEGKGSDCIRFSQIQHCSGGK